MKRISYIIIGVGAVIIVGLTAYLLIFGGSGQEEPAEVVIEGDIPYTADDKIAIDTGQGTVYINDVLENPVRKVGQKSVVFMETAEYTMSYFPLPEPGKFIISISVANPEIARPQMEKDFIGALGISEEEACKLDVSVNVPVAVNPDTAGVDFGLSFCPGGAPL